MLASQTSIEDLFVLLSLEQVYLVPLHPMLGSTSAFSMKGGSEDACD
jgi:hypothetical protein